MKKYIPVNIWDDFHEDGYVPEGEIQKTYAYVEDDSTEDEQKEYLSALLDHIKTNFDMEETEILLEFHDTMNDYSEESVKRCIEAYGESFFFKRWEIKFNGITHTKLNSLVKYLEKAKLDHKGVPFKIYSES